jgi:hypothetical protein
MNFKPGDILYRKYSDRNDLYCVICITDGPFNIGLNSKFVRMLPLSNNTIFNLYSETTDSASNWFIQVDLNNYDVKEKFIKQIRKYLNDNLGKIIVYDKILDNLLYIEILDALKKYQKDDIVEDKE